MLHDRPIFRVFVSSTFADFKAERDALLQHVFPKLAALTAEHGCRFQAVDLRWGVSWQAASAHRTMTICLEELKRCQKETPRPNLIVLLGNRYGWRPAPETVPASEYEELCSLLSESEVEVLRNWYELDENAIPAAYVLHSRGEGDGNSEWPDVEEEICQAWRLALKRSSWTDDDRRRFKFESSATHQEVIEGVLGNQEMSEHVFCYERKFIGAPDSREEPFFDGVAEAETDLPKPLREFVKKEIPKEQIRSFEIDWKARDDVNARRNFCNQVTTDLRRVIEAEIERRQEEHSDVAEVEHHLEYARRQMADFCGREQETQRLLSYVGDPDRVAAPRVVHGSGGVGKSALMAAVGIGAKDCFGEKTVVIMRFAGISPESTCMEDILRSVWQELNKYAAPRPVPTGRQDLLDAWRLRIAEVGAKRRVTILLDGLDQLPVTDWAAWRKWLPEVLPPGVRMIVSAADDTEVWRTHHQAVKKAFSSSCFEQLEPFSGSVSEELVQSRLHSAGRQIVPETQKAVVFTAAEADGSPLYLQLLADNVKDWRSGQTNLPPLARNTEEMIQSTIRGLAADDRHGMPLVHHALGYLACSRFGLTEDELLQALSADHQVMEDFADRYPDSPARDQLPFIIWSRLRHDLGLHLAQVRQSDALVLRFHHRLVCAAVRDVCLEGEKLAERSLSVAKVFDQQALFSGSKPNRRKLLELPWLLQNASAWERLKGLLTDLKFSTALWQYAREEALTAWTTLHAAAGYSPGEAFEDHWEHSAGDSSLLGVAELLATTGNSRHAERAFRKEIERCKRLDLPAEHAIALGGLADLVYSRGDHQGALRLNRERVDACRKDDDDHSLALALGDLAKCIHSTSGAHDEVKWLLEEQRTTAETLGDMYLLQQSLAALAQYAGTAGRNSEAESLQSEALRICQENGYATEIPNHMVQLGIFRKLRGPMADALKVLSEAETLCRTLGLQKTLGECLGQQGLVLAQLKRYPEAAEKDRAAEGIFREIGELWQLSLCLLNQALTAKQSRNRRVARTKAKEALKVICQMADRQPGLIAKAATLLRDVQSVPLIGHIVLGVVALILAGVLDRILGPQSNVFLKAVGVIGAYAGGRWFWQRMLGRSIRCMQCGRHAVVVEYNTYCTSCGRAGRVT